MNTIEMRLQKLEATNRRYKTIILLIILIACTILFMSFRKKHIYPEVIQAKSFEVVDDYGNVLVRLKQTSGNGVINTFRSNGYRLLNLAYTVENEGYIGVENGSNQEMIRVSSSTDGGGGFIGLYNPSGKRVLSLFNDNGGGNLFINDTEGNNRLFLENNYGVGGLFGVKNSSGYTTFRVTQTSSGNGDVNINNYEGNERMRLSVSGSAGNFQIRNNSKTLIVEAGGTTGENGVVNTFGSSGSFVQGIGSNY